MRDCDHGASLKMEALSDFSEHDGTSGHSEKSLKHAADKSQPSATVCRTAEDYHQYGTGRAMLLGNAAHLTAAALGQVSLHATVHIPEGSNIRLCLHLKYRLRE